MTHYSDDDLILLHYGELADSERHLDGCEPCRARLEALRNMLAITDAEPIPEPRADYEEHVWKHVGWRLRPARRRVWLSAAAAAVLLLAFLLGQWSAGRLRPPVSPTPPVAEAATATQTVPDERLAFAAESHLDRSSRLLLEVSNGEGADVDTTELVASNRLYRVMAERAGASDVAKLLDELEPILLELEHGGDVAAIRKRIEERELLFKLRVIRSRVGSSEKPTKPIQKGMNS